MAAPFSPGVIEVKARARTGRLLEFPIGRKVRRPARIPAVLRQAPEQPEGLTEALERLLDEPSLDRANPVLGGVMNFRDWGQPTHDAGLRFMEESEWNWRDGRAPVADR